MPIPLTPSTNFYLVRLELDRYDQQVRDLQDHLACEFVSYEELFEDYMRMQRSILRTLMFLLGADPMACTGYPKYTVLRKTIQKHLKTYGHS